MSEGLQVVFADILAASNTFKAQAPVFRKITEYGFMAFQGSCDLPLYDAIQTFAETLDTGQETIADAIYAHGVKLKLAHDNYDTAETANTMTAQRLFQALENPNVIE
jgi:Family of unknown function (DUF6317)